MELRATNTVRETLDQAKQAEKGVSLHLRNGMTVSGRIGEVAAHQVVICELTGKEFYDALVLIEDISVVEVRAR